MKNYIAPKMDIVLLDVENVITASDDDNDFNFDDLSPKDIGDIV